MKTIYFLVAVFSIILILKSLNEIKIKQSSSKEDVNLLFSKMYKSKEVVNLELNTL